MDLFNDKKIKQLETRIIELESQTNKCNCECGETYSILRPSFFKESGEQQDSPFDPVLHKEQPLVDTRTSFNDCRDRNLSRYLGTDTEA